MSATPIASNCSPGSPLVFPSSTSPSTRSSGRRFPDSAEALLVDGGGIDGGNGGYFANHGDDLHAVGTLDPIIEGWIGCIVIQPDGSRYLARAVPDPLAEQEPD